MPTQPYILKDGTRVPGTTTIIGRFKESGALIDWAWKEGIAGRDYKKTRDAAANAGTLAHGLVEAWINGGEAAAIAYPLGQDLDIAAKASQAYQAFREWADQTQLRVTHSELPLISEKYRFGGTIDSMLVNGKLSLGDWKSSNAIYHDYLLQLAAYGILWEEHFPDQPITGGYHICRFSKTDADFEHRWFGELEDAKEMFLHLRAAYDLDQKLRKRVR